MAPELDRDELERLLSTAEALPSCPPVLNKVAEICRDPASNARDLGNVIATDEALTSRLIKMVNSAYYGLRGTVSTVTQAVVVLGYQEIKNMVYAVRAEDVFRGGTVTGGIDLLALWDHSLQVAVLAREMSYSKRYPIPEEVFVAGIIHDIGQVVLNQLLGADYRKFRDRAHADRRDLVSAENQQFGISHTEIGRRLAEKWNFPESLQAAVACHHHLPADQEISGVAPFVLAANQVTVARGRGEDASEALAGIGPGLLDYLKLNIVRLDEELGRAAEEYNRIRGTFDLSSAEEAT
jgi:putative nucleotidyltransferase with HDIG domain